MSDDKTALLERMTALPTAPKLEGRPEYAGMTREVEVDGDTVRIAAKGDSELEEGSARETLEAQGLDPSEWMVKSFKTWTTPNGSVGTSYQFVRATGAAVRADIDELISRVEEHRASPVVVRPAGDHAFIVALGDMQIGKADGDGPAGTVKRAIDALNQAADTLAWYRKRYDIGHIHIAWLGDHVEGFQSQGGANVWRTPMTLSDQIRVVQRIMFHALETFAPLAERVTMAAVPGNHGETQRFSGKGITTYDDSFDTLALLNVQMVAEVDAARYGHVEFYVPERDEMTVTLELAGTVTAHAHGHQIKGGRYFDWWKGQAFGDSPLALAKLLLLGHLHHFHAEENGDRLVVQVPALESESTWWRHATGEVGNPGIVVAVTKDGKTNALEVVR